MRFLKSAVVLSTILLVSGCSSTNDVASKDWGQRGYDLAFQGKAMAQDQSIPTDKVALYQAGYDKGLTEFCRQNGYEVAWAGVDYENTCEKLNPLFMAQYNMGLNDMQQEDWDYLSRD
ncbi:DUF2799 domain-containing protein [Vibrio cionasavignyae]|uniref:DUF2799 domain-containing protein n=1 Tax=Vibrio cionasavignyae TaxID=2910252 RepID=UPI003D1228B0